MDKLHAKAHRTKDKQLAKMETQSYGIAKVSHHVSSRKMDRLLDKQAAMDFTDTKLQARIERAQAKSARAGNAVRAHVENTRVEIQAAAQQRMPLAAQTKELPPRPQPQPQAARQQLQPQAFQQALQQPVQQPLQQPAQQPVRQPVRQPLQQQVPPQQAAQQPVPQQPLRQQQDVMPGSWID